MSSEGNQRGYALLNKRLNVYGAPVFFDDAQAAIDFYRDMMAPTATSVDRAVRSLVSDFHIVCVGEWLDQGAFSAISPYEFIVAIEDLYDVSAKNI